MNDDRFYMDDPWPLLQKATKPQKGELRRPKGKLEGYPVFDRQTLIENVASMGRDLLGFSDDVNDERAKELSKKAKEATHRAKTSGPSYAKIWHGRAVIRHERAADAYPEDSREHEFHKKVANNHRAKYQSLDIDEAAPLAIQRQHRAAASAKGRRRMGASPAHQTKVITSTHPSQMRVKKPKGVGKFNMPPIGLDIDDDYEKGFQQKRTDDIRWHTDKAIWPTQMLQTAVAYDSGLDERIASGKVDLNWSQPVADPRHPGAPMQKSKGGNVRKSVTQTDDYIVRHFDRVAGGIKLNSAPAEPGLDEDGVNW